MSSSYFAKVKVYYTKESREKPTIEYEDTLYDADEKANLILKYWDDVEKVEIIDRWGDVRATGWPVKREAYKPRPRSPVQELDKAFAEGKKKIRM